MRKVKQQIPTGDWDDIDLKHAPDDSRKVSENGFTEGTKNIDTETDGTLRKMKGGVQFYTLGTANNDQHEAIFSDGTRHLLTVDNGDLRFTAGVASSTSVTSGFTATANFEFSTTKDRVYMGNGINANQVYDKTAAYGGVNYSVPRTKVMGAQVPGSALTAALAGSGTGVPAGAHTYKVTFLYYDSQESNGSATSNLITAPGGGEDVDLTSIPIGGYGVTARKIYRDDNDGVYVLITTINNNTATTFTDTASGGTTPIPTDNGIPLTFGLIKLYLSRLFFAKISGEPFTIYFSEVGLPDIVQSTNFIDGNPEDPITTLTVYQGRLVVFNRRSMGQILGSTKDTFRYDPIESSIGCVDTRSIQEIVLRGVPVLVWLSDKGFYGFNGSSIFYLSESIEPLINDNVKQSVIQRSEQVHTTNSDFTSGTPSEGIDIAGGQFTTRGYVDGTSVVGTNPRRTWNDTGDWDGGDSLDNIATIDQGNTVTIVDNFSEEPATEGTKDNVIDDGGVGIELATSTDFTGVSNFSAGSSLQIDPPLLVVITPARVIPEIAQPIIAPRAGTLTEFKLKIFHISNTGGTPSTFTFKVWRDNGFGTEPGAEVFSGNDTSTSSTSGITVTTSVSIPVGINEKIWIGVRLATPATALITQAVGGSNTALGTSGVARYFELGWINVNLFAPYMNIDTTFISDPVAASGTWTSSVFDTKSTTTNPLFLNLQASYPTDTGSTITLEGGEELDFAGNIIVTETQTVVNSFGFTITLGAHRFYQIKVTLTTTDDRSTPTISTAIAFDIDPDATWISDIIDTTADSTVFNALTTVSTTPGSSTVTTEIRTATTTGGLPAAPFVAFGSVTVRQFVQVRLIFFRPSFTPGVDIPFVTSVDFDWTIVSNLVSPEIDTNVDPAGWDVFQTDFNTNGGTAVFELRSATTSGGLSGAAYFTVTNGNFPPSSLPTDQFVQWRATITSTDSNVPVVSSVTIKWFIGDTENVRAASIFFNKNYYISLAEFGNDENNVIIQLDANGKWRLKRGLGVNTFGFFFNEPYFGSSTSGVIGKFLLEFKDLGSDIEIDIRTRAFDYSNQFFDNSDFTKVPESVVIEGRGTGCTYDISFSLDNGATFTNMLDAVTGTTTFTTINDDRLFGRIFKASDNIGEKSIIYRVHTNDEFDIKLHRIKATAFVTQRESIITG